MTEQTETAPPTPSSGARFDPKRPQVRIGAVIAVAVAIGFVVWLIVGRSSDSNAPAVPSSSTAVAISVGGLRTLAGVVKQPIYWAGQKKGLQYELTRGTDGRVWIRYLPTDEKIGEQKTPYLTIGTYPVANAYAATRAVANKSDSVRLDVGKRGVASYSSKRPTSVYLAYPGSAYQIEVFDPSAT